MNKTAMQYNERINRYAGVTSDGTYIEIDAEEYRSSGTPLTADQCRFGQPEADFLNQWDCSDPDQWSDDIPGFISDSHHLGHAAELSAR